MASGQAPFGVCRRLDEAYLKTVLEQDEYALVPSETGSLVKDEAAAVAEPAPSLDLAKAIRHTNFGALHRLLTFPLTEMISTAPPNLPSTSNFSLELFRGRSPLRSAFFGLLSADQGRLWSAIHGLLAWQIQSQSLCHSKPR